MNTENRPNDQISATNNLPTNSNISGNNSIPVNTIPTNNDSTNAASINSQMSVAGNQTQAVASSSSMSGGNVAPTTGGIETPVALTDQGVQQSVTPVTSIGSLDSKGQKTPENLNTHEVTEVLSSSFGKKEKVNLLTPEQKAELTRKREEAMREKESYQPAPVGKFKQFMSAFLILALFAIIFFLPEINNYIVAIMNNEKEIESEVITTGVLRCTSDRVDEKYNISYSYDFDFTDSKLDKLTYVEATTGDEFVDAEDLNLKLEKCDSLKTMVAGLSGVKVTCSLYGGTLTREQMFDYTSLNTESVSTAYIEAGGEYPGEFQKGSSIDSIERNMKAAGYSCDRHM